MKQEEDFRQLQIEHQALQEELRTTQEQLAMALARIEDQQALQEELRRAQEQLAAALARIEELEKKKTEPPAFVKANVEKPKEKKPRKKRAAEKNGARKREKPTQIQEHLIRTCPICEMGLGGITLARRRQVVELPPPPPVEVIEHRIYKGWCTTCGKWREAPVDLGGQVMGQGRLGVRISSAIAYLRTIMRLPIRQIQAYLSTLHGLQVSIGEIVELLHRIREQTKAQVESLKAEIRASPAIQADETSWREDGINGYIWSVNTPKIRYYEYHHSRSGDVIKELVGESFEGVMGSDFYAGDNKYLGPHQRCWVHLLRDIRDLKKKYPDDADLLTWAKEVKALYRRAVAQACCEPDPSLPADKQAAARRELQHAFEQELWQVCAPYAHTTVPMHTLCERVERFLPELFVFVAVPGVPADNNLAERSVRPLVIARKISGGSRSPKGSETRMALFSLFSTWGAQGQNPFFQCLSLLSQPSC